MAVIEDLQKDVKYIRMRLFNLIEENDGIRISPHLFTELAALVVAHIAWRRANHLGDAVLLHVLRHIDADQCVLRTKHGLGQRL